MQALANQEVGDLLSKHFVSSFERVGKFRVTIGEDGKRADRNGGNVAAFFCTPSGRVIHAVAGPRTAEAFLAETKWALKIYSEVTGSSRGRFADPPDYRIEQVAMALRNAHASAHQVITKPNSFAPDLELIYHEPSADPNLRNLEQAGLKRREQVHHLLKARAFEPLATLGPKVYSGILGETVTAERVDVGGATEANQASAPAQTLSEFFASGGSAQFQGAAPPSAPQKNSNSTKGTGSSRPRKSSR